MTQDKDRDAFEAWMLSIPEDSRERFGILSLQMIYKGTEREHYMNYTVQKMFVSWRAAVENERLSSPRCHGNRWNTAIEYLKRYQAWRTGEDDRTLDEAGITPRGITEALNVVLNNE